MRANQKINKNAPSYFFFFFFLAFSPDDRPVQGKHYLAYSLEASDGRDRKDFDATVSARDLVETYMVPFKMYKFDMLIISHAFPSSIPPSPPPTPARPLCDLLYCVSMLIG